MSKVFSVLRKVFFLVAVFFAVGVDLQCFDSLKFLSSAWGGPKKVGDHRFRVSEGDRFIPGRSLDESQLLMQSLRGGGFFDSTPPDHVREFIFREALSQRMFGVSIEEGRRGGILFHPTVAASELRRPRDVAQILRERDYHVEPREERRLAAPGMVNDFYSRTFDANGKKFAIALGRYDDEIEHWVYDLFAMALDNESSALLELAVTTRRVTYVKWLNQTDLLVGYKEGSFTLFRVVDFSSPPVILTPFNGSAYVSEQGVPDLRSVVGATYLESSRKLIVGYSSGKFLSFDFEGQEPVALVGALSDEVSAQHDETMSFEFSPSQTHLAVGTRDRGVFVYEWPTFQLALHIPVIENSSAKALAWHPKRSWLAVGTGRKDHRLMVYSMKGKKKKLLERDLRAQVTDLAWSESGTELVTTLGYLSDGSRGELDTSLLLWAVVEDGLEIDLKRLESFQNVKGRALAVGLDTSESSGRLFTLIRVLMEEGEGCVVSLRYSRVQPKEERNAARSSTSLGGAFGFLPLMR